MHLMTQIQQAAQQAESSWDEPRFWVSVASALITLLAVVVALFRDNFHEWRKKPKLDVAVDPEGIGFPEIYREGNMGYLRLRLSNARGRDTADEVEVWVTVETEEADDGSKQVFCESAALIFENPHDLTSAKTSGTVPAGFSRPVWFAEVGDIASMNRTGSLSKLYYMGGIDEQEASNAAVILVESASGRISPPLLTFPFTVNVSIVVTGRNFDAVHFAGQLSGVFEPDEGDVPVSMFKWTRLPMRVSSDASG